MNLARSCMPEVAIFDPGTRQWRYENEYPLKRTQWTPLFLRSDAALSLERPAEETRSRLSVTKLFLSGG